MDNQLESLLNKLYAILVAAEAPVAKLLQNGIDKKTVDETIQGLGLKLPSEVYTLYKWRNGAVVTGSQTFDQTWIFPLGGFPPIEDAIANYEYGAGNDDYWNEKMFMLFESGAGEMYLIDCDDQSSTYGMIYKHWAGAVDFEVIITMYDSLKSFLHTVVECFEKEVYHFDESGGLQFDFKMEVDISRKNNPGSELWKLS
jgi:hypothetical protein